MRSLGLDPGGQKGLAWAIYDSETDCMTVGMKKPGNEQDPAVAAAEAVSSLIVAYKPEVVGIELQHIARLPQSVLPHERAKLLGMIYAQAASALGLAQVVGACKVAAQWHDIPVVELQPATIKQAITGRGNASKAQVRGMVETMYGSRMELVRGPREHKTLREDEADAAAMAVAAQRRAR